VVLLVLNFKQPESGMKIEKRILCHNDGDAAISNGGYVRFPKYIVSNNFKRLSGLDRLVWPRISKSAKSVFPVMLYFRYIKKDSTSANPSQDTLCKLSGIGSRNTVRKACDELCSFGIFSKLGYIARNGHKAYSYDIDAELNSHANGNFLPLPKYVIKDGLWAELGKTPVAQALYWAMRSFEWVSHNDELPICTASRKDLCERAGISVASFYAAQNALVESGFMLPNSVSKI